MKKFLTTLAILLTSTIGFSATKEEIKKAEIELDNFFNGKYGFNIYENIVLNCGLLPIKKNRF